MDNLNIPKKMSTPGPVLKYWLRFSYFGLEGFELDLNIDKQK